MSDTSVFIGLLVDCRHDWSLRAEHGILVVQGDRIVARHHADDEATVLANLGQQIRIVRLGPAQFLLPGLIDTHIHASQFPNAGLALDLTLLDWLERYTFPMEAGLSCPEKARDVYRRCVRSTLSSGTTTACYFATVHRNSTQVLGEVCMEEGQRALVGKVCMDRNSPDIYGDGSTEESLSEAEASINGLRGLNSSLITPIITPRFVPTCSRSLLKGLGDLAKRDNLPVQTHLAENCKEIEWVRDLEPDCENYTQVYSKCGLLGPRTVLAHCVHLSDQEIQMIHESESGVSHCPNSNFSLKSGLCNVQRLRKAGVKVGLGTDCSGGYSPSMINALRQAVTASNALNITKVVEEPISFSDALYLATRGGAQLLDRDGELGILEVGGLADILLVNMEGHENTRPFGHESSLDLVHKFVFLGDDRNIQNVWVGGRQVKGDVQS